MKTVLGLACLIACAIPGVSRPSTAENGTERMARDVGFPEVQKIFEAKCVRCHSGADAAQGLGLESWDQLAAGSNHGEAVIAFDPDNSLLVELSTKLIGGPHPAELGETPLTPEELEVVSAWIAEGAPSESGEALHADADQLLYVTNQAAASVSVIDMESNQVIRTVDLAALGFPPNAFPHHVAVEPDGSSWYVSLIAANAVLKFDRLNQLVGRVEMERPGLLALDPDGDRLFAARSMMAVSPPSRIGLIDRGDMRLEEIDVLLPRPHALAVGRGGTEVYTSSLSTNQVAVLDPAEEAVELTDLAGERPHVFIGFAISPDGRTMVGTSEVTSKLFIFDLERAPAMTPVDTLDTPMAPWHPVYTHDGRWVYFGNNWDNSVSVVDMERRELAKVIRGDGLAQPHGSAVSPDGRHVYVANRNLEMPPGHSKATHVYAPRYDLGDNAHVGTVLVIDTETQQITKIIEVEEYASGLGTAARRWR